MSNEGTPPKPSIVTPGPGLRLDSTKEIANYLKRSPRTVHRWEREEGLPVHRHQHRKKGTLYAYASEIDDWLKGRVKKEGEARTAVPPTSSLAVGLAEISKLAVPSGRPVLIAVLPLRNLGGNPAKESFADALTDEIISELSQVSPQHLRVIAFTSVAHYKDSTKTIQQIGEELRVDYVIEGGVRWYGRRVRMTARLIAARDQAQIWADSFEIQLPPVFALQQGLARGLSGTLATRLGLPVTRRPRLDTTCNPAAHDACLLGNHLSKWSEADIKKSLDFFSRAIEIDPNCAPAYAELAYAWFRLGYLFDYPPVATLWVTRDLALKALGLDAELCRGHVAMASWNLFGAWNWPEAEGSSRRAVELNPSDGGARIVVAACKLALHRPDEAAEELRQALRLDPLSPMIGVWFVMLGFLVHSYDTTIEGCQKLLLQDTNLPVVHAVLGDCFAQKGDCARAITHGEKARALSQGQIIYTASLSSVYALAGRRTAAERLVQELLRSAPV